MVRGSPAWRPGWQQKAGSPGIFVQKRQGLMRSQLLAFCSELGCCPVRQIAHDVRIRLMTATFCCQLHSTLCSRPTYVNNKHQPTKGHQSASYKQNLPNCRAVRKLLCTLAYNIMKQVQQHTCEYRLVYLRILYSTKEHSQPGMYAFDDGSSQQSCCCATRGRAVPGCW